MLKLLASGVGSFYYTDGELYSFATCLRCIFRMKTFSMQHVYSRESKPEFFDENNAPDWLTSTNTMRGSTMDDRWFWNDYVLQLDINESVKTDFQTITRLT